MITFCHNNSITEDAAIETTLADEDQTIALGKHIAPILVPGLVVYLNGNLGAGKTTLVRGILRALGHNGKVKSPTYTLIELYAISRLNLYHFDFYRFQHAEEFLDAGLEEYFSSADGVCLVEWADKAQPFIPSPDLEISLRPHNDGRSARLVAQTDAGRQCLKKLLAQTTSLP